MGIANATPISVSQTQDITSSGQNFVFNFLGLDGSDGSGGLFNFSARGDYTDPINERPTITLDALSGSLVLNDSGIVSNTITGLSLNTNNTVAGGGGVDQALSYIFNLNGALLDSLLTDSNITVNVDNSSSVDSQASFRDFVQVGFNYESSSAPVPAPATLALFGLGLAGLGWSRRKKA